MDIEKQIAEELNIKVWQVQAVVKLIDEGNTIPFIARYRKEMHGSLDDTALRNLDDRLTYLRNLLAKKEQVIASIDEQECMTEELRLSIMNAVTQVEVDDLYRPFRPKRKTRAVIAREKGLELLADIIKLQIADTDIMNIASDYVSDEKGVASAEEAISGASDIIAEDISDNADYRMAIRDMTRREGLIISAAKDSEAKSVYENYYDFSEPVKKISGYRILAINRGEKEKYLTVKLEAPYERIIRFLEKKVIVKDNPYTVPVLKAAIVDSYERLIAPSVEREIRNELTENAENGAVAVFGKNLTQLLMQPPIAGKTVLGWDPAFRTGCKLAVVDATGKVLDTTVVYPTMPRNRVAETKRTVDALIKKYLMERMEVPDYKAEVCAAFAQGNLGKAIKLAGSEHFNELKDEVLNLMRHINEMDISELVEAVKRCTLYKVEINDYLDLIMVWYRDVLLYKATREIDKVVFKDQIDCMREQARRSSYEGIETILDSLDKAKARLKANVNFDLVMELLFLTIKEN